MARNRETLLLLIDVGPAMHNLLPKVDKVCSMLVQKKMLRRGTVPGDCVVYKKTSEEKFPTLRKYSDKAIPSDKFATHKIKLDYEYKSVGDPNRVVPPDQRIKGFRYGLKLIYISSANRDAVKYKPEKSVKLVGFTDSKNIISAKSISRSSALRESSQAFIQVSCKKTLYIDLCVRSLTRFAPNNRELSPHDLAHIALTVSLVKARYTRSYLLYVADKLKTSRTSQMDSQAVQDCLSQITDGVEYLSQTTQELRHIVKSGTQEDFDWCTSNIETFLSTVLTDAGTCLEEFPGHAIISAKTKAIVKAKVVNVAEASSNALALFHGFANKYRSSNRWVKKSP